MSERNELARVIKTPEDFDGGPASCGPNDVYAGRTADAILAAGYRKPRTITTAEELDALPEWSVVRSEQGTPWEKCAGFWAETLGTGKHPASHIALPATVLWEPK